MSYFEGIYSAFLGNLGEHWILLIHLVIDCLAYQQLTIYTKLQVIWTRTVTTKSSLNLDFLSVQAQSLGRICEMVNRSASLDFLRPKKWNVILPLFICNVDFDWTRFAIIWNCPKY